VIATTILIEPIARGVRLEILTNAISALRKRLDGPIFVVTRADFASVELAKSIDPACANLHFVPSDVELSDANASTLGFDQLASLLDTCAELVGPDDPANLIFLGADDYCEALTSQRARLERRFATSRCFALVHRKEPMLTGQDVLDEAHMTLIALHESVQEQRHEHRAVAVLADPWHGQLAPDQRNGARRLLGFASDTLVMAAFAETASTKDATQWSLAAQALAKSPHTHLAVIGDGPAHPMLRPFSDRISYVGPPADSTKHRALFAAADIILVPRSFPHERTRTAGAPLLSSRALRARTCGFGAAFDREATRQLQQSIDFIHRYSAREMTMLRSALDRLAHDRLLGTFRKRLRSAVLSA
jgi:hypothetical protein